MAKEGNDIYMAFQEGAIYKVVLVDNKNPLFLKFLGYDNLENPVFKRLTLGKEPENEKVCYDAKYQQVHIPLKTLASWEFACWYDVHESLSDRHNIGIMKAEAIVSDIVNHFNSDGYCTGVEVKDN